MENRKLPFGYEIKDGMIGVSMVESEIVRMVFRKYAEGESYMALASWLNEQGIQYHENKSTWNKNMIARILDNTAYLGAGAYPVIVDADMYEAAEKARQGNAIQNTDPNVREVRKLARCAMCGGRIKIYALHRGWIWWNCEDCGGMSKAAVTAQVMAQIETIWQMMQRNECVITEPRGEKAQDATVAEARRRLDEALNREDFDEQDAEQLAMDLAAARFAAISSERYETCRINYELAHSDKTSGINIALLKSIASAILIHPDGCVSIRLKNGQLIGGKP